MTYYVSSGMWNLTKPKPKPAAKPVTGFRRWAHITDTLANFHWLRAPEWVKFKLAVVVYSAFHGTAPQYLSDQWLAEPHSWHAVSGVHFGRQLPTNLQSVRRVLSQLANDHLLLLAQSCETVFRMKLHLHHWLCFRENRKHIYFGSRTFYYYLACLWSFLPWWF